MKNQKEHIAPQNPSIYHIGIDLMGSDVNPTQLLDSILNSLDQFPPSAHLTLFATSDILAGKHSPSPHIALQVVPEFISMKENPLSAIRNKKQSSICIGMNLLKEKKLNAFVSSGNTGALIASSKLFLPMLPGITRPALLTPLPTRNKSIAMLDVGANTSCRAEQLVQFALIGSAYQKRNNVLRPKVGLLNIGSEAQKGTPELRKAHELLQRIDPSILHFIGNIEARDVFQGELDVLVTDGFTGNIFLKTAEGIASVILEQFQQIADQESSPQLQNTFLELHKRLHYAEYPGAILCGIDRIVMKCHGNAASQSLINTIICSIQLLEHKFLEKVTSHLASN